MVALTLEGYGRFAREPLKSPRPPITCVLDRIKLSSPSAAPRDRTPSRREDQYQGFNGRPDLGGLRSLRPRTPKKPSTSDHMCSRPDKALIAQRGAEGPGALQTRRSISRFQWSP